MSTLRTYTLGFVLSIALTLAAFGLVQKHLDTVHIFPTHEAILPVIVVLAVVQLFVQLIFFLHLGEERRPRWSIVLFAFALIVVVILVGGTLWIMNNLRHQQMQEAPNMFIEENIFPPIQNE